ncbi:CHAT domain-containing protein [Crenothrix polyspora]|uniref:CHAT domain-containing protein n=1 Tax=Crenothrix polyspora TaxID=360316 RepID=A0A1R4HE24_9GAMM|nr:CHAT domain-containing protein [Crenothrix polyspora]SJM94498.1 exported hypothetical protein [Crenothrix polyspora]
MASSKQFWLYTVSLIFFTSHVYAGCSNATLKGNYSVQGVVQIQGKQCQISGNWLLDGKGGGLQDRKGGNCPELVKPKITPFQYKLGSNCRGRSTSPDNSNDFQVMRDGRIKLLEDAQIEVLGTLSHPLSSDETKTINQGQLNWANNGKPTEDLPLYQEKWLQLQAGWHTLKFKASTTVCPSAKPQGNYAYRGKSTIEGKQCQVTGNWMFNEAGAGWTQGKTQCPGQKETTVNQPLRYKFDDNCQITFKALKNPDFSVNLQLLGKNQLKLSLAAQAVATGTFSHALTENEANTIKQGLTDWDNVDNEIKWYKLESKWNQRREAGKKARDTGNFQEAEKIFQAVLADAKANTVAGASWDDLIEAGIKAGEAGNFTQAKQQLKAAEALSQVASSQSDIGGLFRNQDNLKQAGSFYQQCVETLKGKSPEKLHTINFSKQDLANDYKGSEILYNKVSLVGCLTSLAGIRKAEYRYAEAETFFKKAQAIARNTFSQESQFVFFLLNALDLYAHFEMDVNNYGKAEELQHEILTIRQKTLSADDPDIGASFSEIGDINRAQGRYAEAEENLQNSLTILQKAPPENQDKFADALYSLSRLEQEQGRYGEAIKLLQQSLDILRKLHGENHPFTFNALNNLALSYSDQGMTGNAEKIYRQVLERRQNYPIKNFGAIAICQNNLATTLMQQGRYQEAKELFLESTKTQETLNPDGSPSLSQSYNNLGNLYMTLGQYGKAEPYLKKALATASRELPPSHPNIALVMSNLAYMYVALEQYEKAEPLLQNGLAIRQKTLRKNHPDLAHSMNNLARFYQQQAGKLDGSKSQALFEKAETLYKQALAVAKAMPSDDNAQVLSDTLYYLATCYQDQKQDQEKYKEAKPLYEQSLAIQQKILPAYHPTINKTQRNLAGIYRDIGDRDGQAKAETLYQAVLDKEQANYPNNPPIAITLSAMAILHDKKGDTVKALDFTRQSLAIHAKIQTLTGHKSASSNGSSQSAELIDNRKNTARLLVRLQQKLMAASRTGQLTNLPEAFQALQLAHGDQRTQSLQQTALRLSSRNPDIQKKVQMLWNQQTLWQNLDKRYVEMLSKPGQESAAIAKELQIKQQVAEQEIEKLDKALQQDFPAYAQLIHPEPITLEKVQALLKPDEALLTYLVDEEASYVFVVRPGQAPVLHRLDRGHQAISNSVTHLSEALKNPQQELKPFELKYAYGLYEKIFKPIETELNGVKHILAVTDGALQQLPLHLLVKTMPPATPDTQHGDYAHADWLARHYAFSYLPAVHSLAYLRGNRNLRQGSHAKAPFIGFGDPLLKENLVAKASQPSEQFQSLGQYVALGGDPSETLRENLVSVPQTAIALTDIAALFGVTSLTDPKALYLDQSATESQVKQLSDSGRLRQHRIVGFATHALLPEIGESGLVLTPPPKSDKSVDEADLNLTPALESSGKDDGYLTAGEAAALDLDADWVLLAACNTATLQGTSEGLSQLSKGFFVAGARSVLASQWPVEANAMQHLTRHLFNDLHDHPTLSRAEALQHSMQQVINRETRCNWKCKLGLEGKYIPSHPAYWAPFVILGEGGAIPVATAQLP